MRARPSPESAAGEIVSRAASVQGWWNENPMTYAEVHGTQLFGGKEQETANSLFEEADRQFLEWNRPLHSDKAFGRIFPFSEPQIGEVLEIGCGLGKMASLWAANGNQITAIDLNRRSLELTRLRFELAGLTGEFLQADARHLPFNDCQFDYIYSWGVLHHSPNLEISLSELLRCLKPGHKFGIMLYHRHSVLNGYWTHYLEGWLHEESRYLNPLELTSRYGDGGREEGNPHTRPISKREISDYLLPHSSDLKIQVLGTDLDSLLKYLFPLIGNVLPAPFRKAVARRFGWSLWISGRKR